MAGSLRLGYLVLVLLDCSRKQRDNRLVDFLIGFAGIEPGSGCLGLFPGWSIETLFLASSAAHETGTVPARKIYSLSRWSL